LISRENPVLIWFFISERKVSRMEGHWSDRHRRLRFGLILLSFVLVLVTHYGAKDITFLGILGRDAQIPQEHLVAGIFLVLLYLVAEFLVSTYNEKAVVHRVVQQLKSIREQLDGAEEYAYSHLTSERLYEVVNRIEEQATRIRDVHGSFFNDATRYSAPDIERAFAQDVEKLREVVEHLVRDLREGWSEALHQLNIRAVAERHSLRYPLRRISRFKLGYLIQQWGVEVSIPLGVAFTALFISLPAFWFSAGRAYLDLSSALRRSLVFLGLG
jgi:hypothetical protein